jgi:hypothetical protein
MSFIRHSKYKSIYLANEAFPNFYGYNVNMPYYLLYTKEARDIEAPCYVERVLPKWTLVNTDPFLKKLFDNQEEVLRKTEVNRVLSEFTRNVNIHLQKGKIAKIKEAAEQYSA